MNKNKHDLWPRIRSAKKTERGFGAIVFPIFIRAIRVIRGCFGEKCRLAHALTRAERQGRVVVGQAKVFWSDAMTTMPILHPSFVLATRAIDLSSQLRIGVYDCLYVALAERAKCEFVTADDKLVNNVHKQFPFVRHLSTLP